jgi:hypothetical protein
MVLRRDEVAANYPYTLALQPLQFEKLEKSAKAPGAGYL